MDRLEPLVDLASGPAASGAPPPSASPDGMPFDEILDEVEREIEELRGLADRSREAVSAGAVRTDPEALRHAIEETERAFASARHVRSRLVAAYLSTRRS